MILYQEELRTANVSDENKFCLNEHQFNAEKIYYSWAESIKIIFFHFFSYIYKLGVLCVASLNCLTHKDGVPAASAGSLGEN
jgi:hypothetical protein